MGKAENKAWTEKITEAYLECQELAAIECSCNGELSKDPKINKACSPQTLIEGKGGVDDKVFKMLCLTMAS